MSYDSNIIPYKRGDITDTNGTVLATSIDVYTLILDCFLLNQDKNNIEPTISMVRKFFPDIEESTIRNTLGENPDGRYNVLLKNISYKDMTDFSEITADYNKNPDKSGKVTGVWFEKTYKRFYPYDNLASDVIGFASENGVGAIGLENAYNKELSGINGKSYGYLDGESNKERRTVNPTNGRTLVTTLDVNIQSILEQEIASFNQRMSGEDGSMGSKQTAGLVMDPQTGNVLAMADFPSFNLNEPRDLSMLYAQEDLEKMSSDEKLNALNKLWQNFAITSTYEPGSTFKPFTVACGLETGTLAGNEVFFCDGHEYVSDWEIKCVNVNGHGDLTLSGALEESCNDALMQISYRIGADNFSDYQRLFGFGQRTNIDITGEARTDNVMFSKEELKSAVNLATNSFGQNFNVTMIQLASAFSSLVNGGRICEPHIVKTIKDVGGSAAIQRDTVTEKITISKEVGEIMKTYLEAVVEKGTGKTAGVEGYRMGGKTGTAEKLPRGQGNYLVSFIGFAPVDDPKVLIYVVVDEPNTPDQAHSSFAQEIVHNVMTQVLPYMNIEKEVVLSNNITGDEE